MYRNINFAFVADPARPDDIEVLNYTVSSFCIGWTQDGLVDSYVLNITDSGTPDIKYDGSTACVENLSTQGKVYTFTLTAISGMLTNASDSEARTSK